jgi:hypothetical protein
VFHIRTFILTKISRLGEAVINKKINRQVDCNKWLAMYPEPLTAVRVRGKPVHKMACHVPELASEWYMDPAGVEPVTCPMAIGPLYPADKIFPSIIILSIIVLFLYDFNLISIFRAKE